MKKFTALLVLILFSLSIAILPTTAADLDHTGRKNVCRESDIYDCYAFCVPAASAIGQGSHQVEHLFDGIITRGPADGTQNYCDFSMIAEAWTDMVEKGVRYNLKGEADPQGKYLTYVDFELKGIYTVDALRIFLDEASDGKACNLLVDGFDILVRADEKSEWTTVYSVTELYCGNKYKVYTEEKTGLQTCYIEAEFAPVRAQYIRFALTQPRCEKAPHPYVYPAAASRYFRITEIELYADKNAVAETLPPPETKAPQTTAAPETTAPSIPQFPVESSLTVKGMIIGLAVILAVSAVAVKIIMYKTQ